MNEVSRGNQSGCRFRFRLWHLFVLVFLTAGMSAVTAPFGLSALEMLPIALAVSTLCIVVAWMAGMQRNVGCISMALFVPYLAVTAYYCVLREPPAHNHYCQYNMHLILRALESYHTDFGTFPPAQIRDKHGNPMHSWRTLILPYLSDADCLDVYRRYDFSEPWDGPSNRALHGISIGEYSCPAGTGRQTDTSYVAVLGDETVWPMDGCVTCNDIDDEAKETIVIVEIANSGIHWMEPRDLELSSMVLEVNSEEGSGISGPHPVNKWGNPTYETANVGLLDGTVAVLGKDITSSKLKAMLTVRKRAGAREKHNSPKRKTGQNYSSMQRMGSGLDF